MRRRWRRLASVGLVLASPVAAPVTARAVDLGASGGCEGAILSAERVQALPPGLLGAIAQVESGRYDAAFGAPRPWPWTINADGGGVASETAADAIAAVRGLQTRGVRSIDVGCLQVNLLHHPAAFASLEEAFEPTANAAYAARFLRALFTETQDWAAAAAAYHSRTPDLGASYWQRVAAAWGRAAAPTAPPARRWPLRPFALPVLDAVATPAARSGDAARLLAQVCVCDDAPVCPAWGPPRPCASPFATTARLLRALASGAPPG